MAARLWPVSVAAALVLGGALAPAQTPGTEPPAARSLPGGSYELWVGPPGDPSDPASLWCQLDVRPGGGRTIIVPARVGSLMRCGEAAVSRGGTWTLVLQRLQPALEPGGPEAGATSHEVAGLDWGAWNADGRAETWELVGHVEALPLEGDGAELLGLVGSARVTVVEGGRTRTWRSRFLAAPAPDEPPPARDAAQDREDPELGGGWTPPARRAWRYALTRDPSWRDVTASPDLLTPASEVVSGRPPDPPPAGAPPAAEPVRRAPLLLGAAVLLVLAAAAAAAIERRRPAPAAPAAPRVERPAPARAAPSELRAAAALEAFEDGLASLRGLGGALSPEPAPGERTMPVGALFPDQAREPTGPVERTLPVATLFPDEAQAPPGPVERTLPVGTLFPDAAPPAGADRTLPVTELFDGDAPGSDPAGRA